MFGAECVPQRKHAVFSEVFRVVNVLIESAIFAVHVLIKIRREKGVIQRCVKRFLLFLGEPSIWILLNSLSHLARVASRTLSKSQSGISASRFCSASAALTAETATFT